jgi:hypothetical protein
VVDGCRILAHGASPLELAPTWLRVKNLLVRFQLKKNGLNLAAGPARAQPFTDVGIAVVIVAAAAVHTRRRNVVVVATAADHAL